VTWHSDVSSDAIVLELRCTDASGLLYRVTRALADEGANVRAARVATLGVDVVDAFYLTNPIDDDTRSALERVVLSAAG
jgi:[protein-PII] uridylyltransferase